MIYEELGYECRFNGLWLQPKVLEKWAYTIACMFPSPSKKPKVWRKGHGIQHQHFHIPQGCFLLFHYLALWQSIWNYMLQLNAFFCAQILEMFVEILPPPLSIHNMLIPFSSYYFAKELKCLGVLKKCNFRIYSTINLYYYYFSFEI